MPGGRVASFFKVRCIRSCRPFWVGVPGGRIAGCKIWLTSRAMQMASKMTEPDYGLILDDALYNDGACIAAVMGHTAAGIARLVNKLAPLDDGLKKGEIVLGDSFTRPVDIASGDIIQADYGPLGCIGVRF